MIIAVDIDGTICSWHPLDYGKAEPFLDRIEIIRKLYDDGHKIWFYTARGSSLGNAEAAEERWGEITRKQLTSWLAPYSRLIFGKPMFDVLIDDRAVRFDKDWVEQIVKLDTAKARELRNE